MSWWILPVKLTTLTEHFHADRRLAFQVLTAFGKKDAPDASSLILKDEGLRQLVEFRSERGKGKKAITNEWVTLNEPGEILFSGVSGPLQLLEDRFTLDDDNGCTNFRYESTIGVRGWIFGWLVARYYAKPIVEKMMRTHVPEMKEVVEERAKRSRLYPFKDCTVPGEQAIASDQAGHADAVATTNP